MPSKSENTFTVNGDVVYISREGWDSVAKTTYREDYYNELKSHTWMLKNGYPYNEALGGGLHRYIMGKWYGKEVLEKLTARGYVVDHMNNDHTDCQITNLEFLLKDYNTAKGQQLDKDTERLFTRIALTISKDFQTQCYQITIGCNDAIVRGDPETSHEFVDSFKLLYSQETPYIVVINDADTLLQIYEASNRIDIKQTHACQVRIYLALDIQLTEQEKEASIVKRGNQTFLVLGTGKTYLKHVAPDKNWYPPEKGDARIVILKPSLVETDKGK